MPSDPRGQGRGAGFKISAETKPGGENWKAEKFEADLKTFTGLHFKTFILRGFYFISMDI